MRASEIFDAVVRARGIKDIDRFLKLEYDELSDFSKLPSVDEVAKRLEQARDSEEKVVIYGDYDIDGLCATALLIDAFDAFGIKAEGFIPDRFEEGYGLNGDALEKLAVDGAGLVVTVDCGSSSEKEIAAAKKLGLDVIVTDHHEISQAPASAVAVVNPKLHRSKFGFEGLSGAGVAFGLVRHLQSKFKGLPEGQEKWLLDLVALSTISDVVSLTGDNRLLAGLGLKVLKKTRRAGLRALLRVSGTRAEEADEMVVAYRLAPRLNAAGRLEHAKKSLQLLVEADEARAAELATQLDELNYERRKQQDKILVEALKMVGEEPEDDVIVLANKDWSHGINGIVAAKICEKFLRPVFVMQHLPDGTTKGSARSPGSFNLAAGLQDVKELLISGGGHKLAAGATIRTKDLEQFRKRLNRSFSKSADKQVDLGKKADVVLDSFEGINLELNDMLDKLRPFGQGNPEPLLRFTDIKISSWQAVGSEKVHAKLELEDKSGAKIRGIAFFMAEQVAKLKAERIHLLAQLSVNDFGGRRKAELSVVEFQG